MNVSAFGRFFLYFFLSTWVHCLLAQEPAHAYGQLDSVKTLPTQITTATTDALNQVILAWPDGRIQRYDSLMQVMQMEYSNPRFGAPAQLDASNPLHILAYYPDYLHLKVFNRNLILNASLNLIEYGYSQVPIVCTSRDGNLWIYNALDFQFEKIDMQGKKLRSSIRINTITEATPMLIFDTGDQLITIFDNGLVCLFDVFGQYLGQIPFTKQTAYWPTEKHLLALDRDMISKHTLSFVEPTVLVAKLPANRPGLRFAGTDLFFEAIDGRTVFYRLT
jgi:hypothetical protein